MVFRAVVFTFLPTALELVLVCGLLARTFTPIVSALVVATFAAYVAWTAALTRAAAEVSILIYYASLLACFFCDTASLAVTLSSAIMTWCVFVCRQGSG